MVISRLDIGYPIYPKGSDFHCFYSSLPELLNKEKRAGGNPIDCSHASPNSGLLNTKNPSLVPRPVRAIRVTSGGLEPSAIARGLAKNGKKVPDQREKVPDNFSTKILCFLRQSWNILDV